MSDAEIIVVPDPESLAAVGALRSAAAIVAPTGNESAT